jgi:hypothetical protein
MAWLILPLAVSGALWLASVAIMALAQRTLLYRPAAGIADPALAGAAWMSPVHRDGHLIGWWCPPPEADQAVLVVFHGNRGTLARIAAKVAPWRRFGVGIFAATYRGYEGNPGQPSEEGLYADARKGLDWLAEQGFGPGRLVLFGESLGSGVATQMALERPVLGLVLEAPFTSVGDAAAARYPWTPARLLVQDRFDNLAKIRHVGTPILIAHGEADPTVPPSHSRRLAAVAPQGTRLWLCPEGNHLDLHQRGFEQPLEDFVSSLQQTLRRPIS